MIVPHAVKERHQAYSDYNQAELKDCLFMEANGHPDAAVYRRLRNRFDELSYACNSSARLISYQDERNYAEYWAPKLEIHWADTPYYPAMGEIYHAWLEKQAKSGWSDRTTDLNAGSVIIQTADPAFQAGIRAVNAEFGITCVPRGLTYQIFTRSSEHVDALFALIENHQKDFILPKGQFRLVEVPMAQKSVRLGNVSEVTIKERSVLVPLIPLSDSIEVHAKLLRWAEQLLECIELGLHPDLARDWLSKAILDPDRHIDEAVYRRSTHSEIPIGMKP
jgi:hypothetical protein